MYELSYILLIGPSISKIQKHFLDIFIYILIKTFEFIDLSREHFVFYLCFGQLICDQARIYFFFKWWILRYLQLKILVSSEKLNNNNNFVFRGGVFLVQLYMEVEFFTPASLKFALTQKTYKTNRINCFVLDFLELNSIYM